MASLNELLEHVDGPNSFIEFVRALSVERRSESRQPVDACGRSASGWENHTIEDFLDAAVAWAEDSEMGVSQGIDESNVWHRCAVFLYCGKIYE